MGFLASTREKIDICASFIVFRGSASERIARWSNTDSVLCDIAEYASERPDLIDCPVVTERRYFGPSMTFDMARIAIEKELGMPLHEAFVSISHHVVCADRTSQSYRAVLRSGITVLVTVFDQKRIRADRGIISMLKFLSRSSTRNLSLLLAAFERTHFRSGIKRGRELERLASSAGETIRFMPIIWSHTTTNVLTTGFVQSVSVQDYMRDVTRQGVQRLVQSSDIRVLARRTINEYVQTCLTMGTVACDVDGSSLSISPDGRLNLLRVPSVFLRPLERGNLIAIIKALVTNDRKVLGRSLLMLGPVIKNVTLPRFQQALDRVADDFQRGQRDCMDTVARLVTIASRHGISVRNEVVIAVSTFRSLERIIRMVMPERVAGPKQITPSHESRPKLRIDRFAKHGQSGEMRLAITVKPLRSTRQGTKMRIERTPHVTTTEEASSPHHTQSLGIVTASLLLGSALTISLAPISILSVSCATVFLGLGIGSAWTLLRRTRVAK